MRTLYSIVIVFVFALIGTGCQSCEKNPLDPESDNTYTIEGVMYDQDGVTPLKNYPLNIVADKGQSIGGGSDYDYPSSTTTDENGYFKMSYTGNSDYSSLWIGQPSSITPVYGPFLTGIPANKNIERDICIEPKSFILLQVLSSINYLHDTLFVYGKLPSPSNDSILSFTMNVPNKKPLLVYYLHDNKSLINNTWKVPFQWTTSYSGEVDAIRWGVGRSLFNQALALELGIDTKSDKYGVFAYRLKSFPDTTRVTIPKSN
ncbi:MAG: hypothetical protein ACPGEG_08995 [Salibacteraceae bacterium]